MAESDYAFGDVAKVHPKERELVSYFMSLGKEALEAHHLSEDDYYSIVMIFSDNDEFIFIAGKKKDGGGFSPQRLHPLHGV